MCDPNNPFQEVIEEMHKVLFNPTGLQISVGLETVRDICEIDAKSPQKVCDIDVQQRAGHIDLLANTMQPAIREQVYTIVCNVERNVGKEVIPADVRKILEEV